MRRYGMVLGIGALWLAVTALALGIAVTPPASAGVGISDSRAETGAQLAPPAPAAGSFQGSAEWTIGSMTFESRYPDGFAFRLQASSSGGAIVSARVEWQHRPHNRPNQPITIRRADGAIDPATGEIVATWTPSGSTAVPPWVGVYYRWKLRDEAGNEYVTEQASAEYADTSREWARTETDEVSVFASDLPDNMGDLVAEAMAAQHQKYLDGWGGTLPYRPRVILFGDFDAWLAWQVGHQDTTGLGVIRVGVTSDEWGGTVQVLYGPPEELAYGTVVHEVEHLYQAEFLAGRLAFTPGWFIEGDATFYQLDSTPDLAVEYVAQKVRAGQLPPLLQGNGPTTVGQNALDGYYIGYQFFAWLDEKWGIAMHRQIMELLADDLPFLDALEQATGMSAAELEREWRIWLGASPDAPTLVPTWTPPPFLPTPTLMQFGK